MTRVQRLLIKLLLLNSDIPPIQAPACAVDARVRETQRFDPARHVTGQGEFARI
jgi:hypothetical protein